MQKIQDWRLPSACIYFLWAFFVYLWKNLSKIWPPPSSHYFTGHLATMLMSFCNFWAPASAAISRTFWYTSRLFLSWHRKFWHLSLRPCCWLKSALKRLVNWVLIACLFGVAAVDLSSATSVAVQNPHSKDRLLKSLRILLGSYVGIHATQPLSWPLPVHSMRCVDPSSDSKLADVVRFLCVEQSLELFKFITTIRLCSIRKILLCFCSPAKVLTKF